MTNRAMLRKPLVYLIFSGFMFLAALGLGFLGWRGARTASIVIDWTTASELDTAGFNLYRSESADGPYTRINPSLIPGSPDPLVGGSYTYTDKTVVAGKVYYYKLEDVEINGGTSQTGPIEVKAAGGGKTELIFAAALLLLAGMGVFLARSGPSLHDQLALQD